MGKEMFPKGIKKQDGSLGLILAEGSEYTMDEKQPVAVVCKAEAFWCKKVSYACKPLFVILEAYRGCHVLFNNISVIFKLEKGIPVKKFKLSVKFIIIRDCSDHDHSITYMQEQCYFLLRNNYCSKQGNFMVYFGMGIYL